MPPLGDVQPIAVALTSDHPEELQLDVRQIYAYTAEDAKPESDPRMAPLVPAEAARRAGGAHLPGAVKETAVGAARGGLQGALNSVVIGAIQGGIGIGTAIGAAAGAVGGAIAGLFGRHPSPDIGGFTDRALTDTTLRPGYSATGYVYFPAGTFSSLEVILASENQVVRKLVPVEPPR
jgi:hypothetical protein